MALLKKWLHNFVGRQRHLAMIRCNDWIGKAVDQLAPESLLDVGCGDGAFLFGYLRKIPVNFFGVEGGPLLRTQAEERGIKVAGFDLNGRWPYEDNMFDVVFSSQVIEHLHNTRLFIEETYRVLKPGGSAIIASENLCSFLNLGAMCLGYTPFSLMQVCGRYLGNPLGLHYNEWHPEPLPIDHPAFSGVSGHVRVLSVLQAKELFDLAGFDSEVKSIGLLLLPDGLSVLLESFIKSRGHFLIIQARKPK